MLCYLSDFISPTSVLRVICQRLLALYQKLPFTHDYFPMFLISWAVVHFDNSHWKLAI